MLFFLMLACQDSTPTDPSSSKAQTDTPVNTNTEKTKAKAGANQTTQSPTPKASSEPSIFVNDPKLTPMDVIQYDPQKIPFLRNEVFARHGRSFKTQKYVDYFSKQSWYTPDPKYTDARLTPNDHANVKLLKSFEGSTSTSSFLKLGELYYEDTQSYVNYTLSPIDGKTLSLTEEESIYHNETKTVSYVLQGEWVITYTNKLDRKNGPYTLWHYDAKKKTILARYSK